MADKDQNDELMSEINSISKEMGNNFATMFQGYDGADVQRRDTGAQPIPSAL